MRTRHEWALGIGSALLLLASSPDGSAAAAASREGAGRSGDRSALLEAYQASLHAAVPVGGGYRTRNPGQEWRTSFDGRGFTVEPDARGWRWGLELGSYGFAGAEVRVSRPLATSAQGARVAYDWGDGLEEWWVNDARGLEHGFTLERRPDSPPGCEPGALGLFLTVRGDLEAEVQAGGRDVRFLDAQGAPALVYRGLLVLDAAGTELPARFERAASGLRLAIDERGARYPLTIDPVAQQAYLKASNAESVDRFGTAVAISGDTAVIGAPREASNARGVGGDQTDNSAVNAGAAYVFVRSGTTWTQQAYLKASNTEERDLFGDAVAISGNTIVVGAPFEDSLAWGVNGPQGNNGLLDSGAAYVFVRNGSTWSQQAYLKASNTGIGDHFGEEVAISGNTIAIGAEEEDSGAKGVGGNQSDNGAGSSGAVYVFVRNGSSWSQQAYVKASNTESVDSFGWSVALSGNTLVVGAVGEDSGATGVDGDQTDNSATVAGAAYVFVRNGSTWSQQAYLKASNTEALDGFGSDVAVSVDTVVVGAGGESSAATGVNGDQASNDSPDSGAAYVFVRDGSTWSQQAYLKASNTGSVDRFGHVLALDRNSLVVGAPNEDSGSPDDQDDNGQSTAGAAYLFERTGTSWTQAAYLKAAHPGVLDRFGDALSISAGTVLVGAPNEASSATGVDGDQTSNDGPGSGAAFVFQSCPKAIVAFRNAGSNPASYTAAPAIIGGAFSAAVDNALAGQTSSLLFAFEAPIVLQLGGGQTLLCLDLGSGELFTGGNLFPTSSAGGVDAYSLPIPGLLQLEGASACTQALQFGNPPFVLSNAQDLTIGSF